MASTGYALKDAVTGKLPVGDVALMIGKVLIVDSVNGSDATGAPSGPAYATPEAALADASSGDVVFVFPGAYNLSAGIMTPTGVTMFSISTAACVFQLLGVTADTVLITMGENSRIEGGTFKLTSTGHYTLKGVAWPGTTAATAKLRTAVVTVDNSAASDAGTSNVYGCHSYGTGAPRASVDAIRATTINCKSAGLGNKRALLADTAAHTFNCRDSNFDVQKTGAGAGSYIAVETNHASAIVNLAGGRTVTDAGLVDWSQTLGTLNIGAVVPSQFNANALGFNSMLQLYKITWGDDGTVPSGTRYMRIGTGASSSSEAKIRLGKPSIAKSLSVRAITAPGEGKNAVFTLRKNGVDTGLTVTLSGTAITAETTNVSVTFAQGDDASLSIVNDAGSAMADVYVSADWF